jgi:hypothetical protein
MKLYKYIESQKTFIEVKFTYEESCANVYKHFTVTINGKKSNIKGLEKYLNDKDYPSILTANTYFWHSGNTASWRRSNEEKRNGEVYDYFTKENFVAEDTFYLENQNLLKGEKFGIDSENGYFLEYRGEKYHFGFVKKYDFEEARNAIKIRRITKIENVRKEKVFHENLKKVFVTKQDSIKSGNCPAGTENFYKNLDLVKKGFRIRAIRADVLLNIRNDAYTQRAVNEAAKRILVNI